jgi:hypothetical protein
MIFPKNKFNLAKLGKNHKLEKEIFPNSNLVSLMLVSLKVILKTYRTILEHLTFDLNPKNYFLK